MRTNIDIDDELLAKAMRDSGAKTKKAAIEEALKMFVRIKAQARILELRGKVQFFDDVLEENRLAAPQD